MSIRILLADDHNLLRQGLCALINSQEGMEVVGEAENGRAAVRVARDVRPDVVIMNVTMAGLSGIEAARQIRARLPKTKVMALSIHRDGELVTEMLKAGASAYLLKTCDAQDLFCAIRAVVADQTYLSPEIVGVVMEAYLDQSSGTPKANGPCLTPRQHEVLQLLAEGLATKEIALRLKRSAKTVEMHRRHLMQKLGLYSIAELTRYAVRKGLVPLDT